MSHQVTYVVGMPNMVLLITLWVEKCVVTKCSKVTCGVGVLFYRAVWQ